MPDLTGLPALDVLIGMAFLFFLMATVVASINESIQTVLNARGRTLAKGIETLLDDPQKAKDFFSESQIKRLSKPVGKFRRALSTPPGSDAGNVRRVIHSALSKLPLGSGQRKPSYLPSRAFALAVIKDPDKFGRNLYDEAAATIDKIGVKSIRDAATDGLKVAESHVTRDVREADAIRCELESAFDEVMDRASGWYKRYVQWWLLTLALATAIGLNVNAFTVGQRLWKNDALRAAVVQQAQKTVADTTADKGAQSASAASPQSATPAQVAAQIDDIEELKLPVGWDPANTRGGFWAHLAGWLVTAAAVSLGAPFWFDVLSKLSRIRGTGSKEETTKP